MSRVKTNNIGRKVTLANQTKRILGITVLTILMIAVLKAISTAITPSISTMMQFQWPVIIGVVLIASMSATTIHLALERLTEEPNVNFTAVSLVVYLVALVPLFVLQPDATFTEMFTLVMLQTVTAVTITLSLFVRPVQNME